MAIYQSPLERNARATNVLLFRCFTHSGCSQSRPTSFPNKWWLILWTHPHELFEHSLRYNKLHLIYRIIELYGRECELRTIPLEPLVVLWFLQRPHRRWQTGATLFRSPNRPMGSVSHTDTAARREPWNSVPVAVSTSFSRSKMLPIQPRNPTWTSITLIMWSFAHSESGFCIFCLERSLVPFLWGFSLVRLTPFVISIMTSPTVVPDTSVLFLATAW